jgi:hypothetical protein
MPTRLLIPSVFVLGIANLAFAGRWQGGIYVHSCLTASLCVLSLKASTVFSSPAPSPVGPDEVIRLWRPFVAKCRYLLLLNAATCAAAFLYDEPLWHTVLSFLVTVAALFGCFTAQSQGYITTNTGGYDKKKNSFRYMITLAGLVLIYLVFSVIPLIDALGHKR